MSVPAASSPLSVLPCGCVRYLDSARVLTDFPCGAHFRPDARRFVKALSILQPFADTILSLAKLLENRDWYAAHRGLFLIHAGKGWDGLAPEDGDDYIDWACDAVGWPRMDFLAAGARRGGLLGVADIYGCVRPGNAPKREEPWANGEWCFLFAPTILTFAEPIPWRGNLQFFDVPAEAVTAAMRTAVPWASLATPPPLVLPPPPTRAPKPPPSPKPPPEGQQALF